jgi:2-octaprenyl-6-methoxyphenol hydroxylase
MSHPLDNIPLLPHVLSMDYDVIIAGGGLNGLTLALALDSAGITTVVIDAFAPQESLSPKFDGRSYALSAASKKMLDALGLWEDLAHHAEPMLEIKVSDGAAGEAPSPFVMQFGDDDFSQGPMGFMVEDRHLRARLAQAVKASNVTLQSGQTITNQTIHSTHVTVAIDGHRPITAAVLVGADGRNSRTAKTAGLTRTGWNYNQYSLVCAISHEKPHHGIAHQYFMPSGPLAILPLTQNRSGIVWTEQQHVAQNIHSLSDADYLDILRPRFGDFLGEISLAGSRYIYPLSLSTTHRMIAPRVALVGDAAHAVHPIAGQGLNSGFKDVAALAEVLCDTRRRGQDLGIHTTLAEYQKWRGFDNALLCTATNSFNRLFSNNNPLLRGIRDLGMGLINAAPKLRKNFVATAAGAAGDPPRLLRGEPL